MTRCSKSLPGRPDKAFSFSLYFFFAYYIFISNGLILGVVGTPDKSTGHRETGGDQKIEMTAGRSRGRVVRSLALRSGGGGHPFKLNYTSRGGCPLHPPTNYGGGAGGSIGFAVRYQGELLGIWDPQNRDPRRKSPPETEKVPWLAE